MKTLLILILAAALAGAAFLTRPTEAHFRAYFKDNIKSLPQGNWFERTWGRMSTDSFLDDCTYHNRYLWADIKHDGKTIYTGAFSHWIERNRKADDKESSFVIPGITSEREERSTAERAEPEKSTSAKSSPQVVQRGK